MEFRLDIETLEDVSPKHPTLMGCSSKPLKLCKLL